MPDILRNRWLHLLLVAVVMGLVGVVGAQLAFTEEEAQEVSGAADRVMMTSPLATGEATGGRRNFGSASDATKNLFRDEVPLNAPAAVAAGWQASPACEEGRGRIFGKAGQQDVPYLLMYDVDDQLLGLYMYSLAPISEAPWERMEELLVGDRPIIPSEHWAMTLYIRDAAAPCVKSIVEADVTS